MCPRPDIAARPVRRDLAGARIMMSPARRLATNDGALVAIGEGIGAIGEGVRRGVDVQEERTAARRVVARGAVHSAAVEDHQRARGTRQVVALFGPRPRELLLGNAENPAARVVVHAGEDSVEAALGAVARPLRRAGG